MVIVDKSAYFVFAFIRINRHTLYPIDFLLDREAHPKFNCKVFLPEHWAIHRQAARNKYRCSASKVLIGVIGKISLHVGIVYSLPQATFQIFDKQTVSIRLGTFFINENILDILLKPKKWYNVAISQFDYLPRKQQRYLSLLI